MGAIYNRVTLILKIHEHLVLIGVIHSSLDGEFLGDDDGAAGEIDLISLHKKLPF
jgi:hypothetical protein